MTDPDGERVYLGEPPAMPDGAPLPDPRIGNGAGLPSEEEVSRHDDSPDE